MNRESGLTSHSAGRALLAALAVAVSLYAAAPLASDRDAYLRGAAQRDIATFDALDRDKNDRLSIEEARGSIDIEARFNDFDINRDGVITRAELTRYVALQYGVTTQ